MDHEARALILELARPIDAARREAFVQAIEERLAVVPTSGPGAVMAAGRELQRHFLEPVSTHGGQVGKRV
jgi:hypothetical protein